MGSFAREPTEEEEAVFDAIIRDVYEQFVTAVTEGRSMLRERVVELADGRVFSGRQALEVGLVDALGDLHRAVETAAAMGGLGGEPALVSKARPRMPLLGLLDELLQEHTRVEWGPRLEYRWR
jgi:protease-4